MESQKMKTIRTAIATIMAVAVLSGTALGADPCARCEQNYRHGMNNCNQQTGASRNHCVQQVERVYKQCKKDNNCKGKKKANEGGNKIYAPSGFSWY